MPSGAYQNFEPVHHSNHQKLKPVDRVPGDQDLEPVERGGDQDLLPVEPGDQNLEPVVVWN